MYVIITPRKEDIYKPSLEIRKEGNIITETAKYLKNFKDKNNVKIIYPYDELKAASDKDITYFKIDHHLTDYGSFVVYKVLMNEIRKKYPDTEIEIMVNEACMQGCPNRMQHESMSLDLGIVINNDASLSGGYATSFCNPVVNKYPFASLVIGTHIFPWDIEEYAKIGITNFKLVGRDGYKNFDKYIKSYTIYLKGVDNYKNILNAPFSDLTHHMIHNKTLKNFLIKDYKKYMPNIEYFKKYGHLCHSRCSVQCNYCYECSKIIQSIYKEKNTD